MSDREDRVLAAKVAAHSMHARHDPRAITEKARRTFLASFLEKVPRDLPEAERLRRAQHLLSAHMYRLAMKSVKSRRNRRKAAAR